MVASDQHSGQVKAIRTHYQGVTLKRCQTHFMRSILDKTLKTLKEEPCPKPITILDAPDLQTARMPLSKTIETYQDKIPQAMEALESGFDDATAALMLPEKYCKRLCVKSAMERLNQEIRRFAACRVIRIFPSPRILGPVNRCPFNRDWRELGQWPPLLGYGRVW